MKFKVEWSMGCEGYLDILNVLCDGGGLRKILVPSSLTHSAPGDNILLTFGRRQ